MKLLCVLTLTLVAVAIGCGSCRAAIKTQYINYSQGGTPLRGYLAYDDSSNAKRPGILIVHEWKGIEPYEEGRARQLAGMGYVAFACDIYGAGVRPQTAQAAGQTASIYRSDRALTRARVTAGLNELLASPLVDPHRVAAIGYCFGGMVALELARSGADIAGVVVFHGELDTPTPQDASHIRCKVLALQGGDDPVVPQSQVEGFISEMRGGHVDWQLVQYGGTVHAYTNPASGNDPSKGAAYNAVSDRRSWQAMKDFFAEIFNAVD